jgi:transposase
MKKNVVIGIDVSKETLDIYASLTATHFQISNDRKGYQQFMKQLNTLPVESKELLVVMEHTGLYSYPFEQFLIENEIRFSKVSALEIKRSAGVTRGKTDKRDSQMIAEYGIKNPEKLSITLTAETNYRLKALLGLREKLVIQKAGFEASLNEQEQFMVDVKGSTLLKTQRQMIRTLQREIEKVEEEIQEMLNADPSTKQNLELLLSIVGVGFVIAATMIMLTDNFIKFNDARKFACYAGIAPFEYSSGTSVKKRTKVSHLANKKIKSLLDMGARAAILHDPEIKQYYNRRVKDGKHAKSIRNIVRNKLVYRMFAVVKRKESYVKNYAYNAA